jgi:predicted HTH transcriptional regulator
LGLLFLSRGTSMRVGRFSTMQTHRIVDGVPPPESMLVTARVVPKRSARRATARRASNRRATARQRKGHIDARILEYVKCRPQSTTGDMAKRLNASRDTIAAEVSHMVRAGDITKELGGQVAIVDAPSTK